MRDVFYGRRPDALAVKDVRNVSIKEMSETNETCIRVNVKVTPAE